MIRGCLISEGILCQETEETITKQASSEISKEEKKTLESPGIEETPCTPTIDLQENSDICIIRSCDDVELLVHNCDCNTTIEAPDFTVLFAPQQTNSCDESTEVLSLHSGCTGKPSLNGHSCTDSDVEVLLSEEINESDWAVGCGTLDDMDYMGSNDNVEHTCLTRSITNIALSERSGSNTGHDVSSVEEFSRHSPYDYELLSRTQLINVITEQDGRIKQLEMALHRFQTAQQNLLQGLDAFRAEMDDINAMVIK